QAAALAARLAGREPAPVEVGWSLATTRSAFEHRAVVVGEDHEHLVAGLQALAAGGEHPGLTTAAPAAPSGGGTVWLFSGQGSQRLGMGAGLYERFPLFAAAFDEVCGLLDPHLEHPLREAVFTGVPGRDGLLDHTTYAQAGLFALQIALARLLGELGVQPDAVAGHSIGEIAAAHVAGVLDLPAACRLVAARATLMGGLPEGGAMASIQATAEELAPDLEAHAGRVAVAALNGPESTVISGAAGPVAEIRERWAERGRKTRTLTVSHAFHSPLMEPVLAGLGESIAGLTYRPPVLPLISNVTGLPAGPEIATPDYWVRHVREPVRFHPAIAHLAVSDAPPHTYLELGPDPVLATAAQHTLHEFAGDGRPRPLVTAVLDRKRPDLLAFTEALARLHTHAGTIGWARYFPAAPVPATVDLPTYRFRHDRAYWLSSAPAPGPGETAARPGTADDGGFWDAVEREDLDSLAHVLGSPADQQPTLGEVLPVLSQWRRRHREQTQVDSWRYQITWKHLPEPGAPVLTGAWPVLIPAGHGEHPAVRAAVEALETHGATVSAHLVEDTGREALTLLLSGRAAASAGVVSLLALDESPCPGHPSVTAGLAATAALVQAADDAGVTGPVWCLTRGAVAVSPGDAPASVPQAEVWGLGRVAALEHPQVWGGLIDLPAALDQGTSAHLAALLAAGTEDQAALRPGAALVRRLRRAPLGAANGHSPWRPDGTTLITGGTGGLGAHVARWLATNGAPHLILTSRRGPDAPGARELADELTALGTRVTITACDVSDRDALQHLLDDIPQEHPLTAVFHIAGVPELARFADLDVPHMEQVLAPKAAAAEHLHDLTRDLDLTAFVLFSSGATSWGSGQQATYAAANAHLDALAEHRRALGLPATSVAWGPWGEAGMAADDDVVAYVGKRGITPLPPAPAITALHDALTHREVTVTVADLDWETFPATFTAQRPSPLIADLVPAVTGPAPGGNGAEPAGGDGGDAPGERLRAQLAASTPAERRHLLLRQVQTRVAAVLGHPDPDTVPPGQPFQELGFDSLSAVELRNRLITATGLDLPPTLIFDHPSCTALAEALRPLLVDEAEDGAADEGRVLSALDTWDSASDPAAVDGPARRRITQRLQALLAKWDGADGTGGGGPAAGPDLETATAEDIFDLIADEFGKS
ncbi:SDR family NAD(P)-dependent oxidoreductase, partial [Actinomadura roseirufa]|uniref:SDR family NAD(P)-dependent oxidoreductase n=1 Tax=Actinomadura roseirufa TaxID=2094049 RepID=UPI001041A12A